MTRLKLLLIKLSSHLYSSICKIYFRFITFFKDVYMTNKTAPFFVINGWITFLLRVFMVSSMILNRVNITVLFDSISYISLWALHIYILSAHICIMYYILRPLVLTLRRKTALSIFFFKDRKIYFFFLAMASLFVNYLRMGCFMLILFVFLKYIQKHQLLDLTDLLQTYTVCIGHYFFIYK